MDTPPPPSDDPRRDPHRPWGSAEPASAPQPAPALEPEDTSLGIKWDENRALFLVLALTGVAFLIQMWMRSPAGPGWEVELLGAFSGQALAEGRWWTLLTSMVMHGGFLHLAMNLSALLPFGMILSRRLGPSLGGQLKWLVFYLGAGLAGSLAWLLLSPEGGAVVGASGAIFGLWAAVIRLPREGVVLPLLSMDVARQLTGPIIANVIVAVAFGVMGGMGGEVAGIAWQAHLGGFVFGLLTIGLFVPRRQA
jgi:membrane associated rhomboid family serine protease